MDAASNQLAPGDLRVSDADRDRALAALSEHYQAGRLTLEEFEERSEQTLKSKTAGELTGLFTDLPISTQVVPPPMGQAVAVAEARPHLPVGRVIATAAGIAAIVIAVSLLARTGLGVHVGGPRRAFGLPIPLLIILFIVLRIGAVRRWRGRGSRSDTPAQDR
jgi:Domain of unknown function (DUF1707)